jgi:hypothetical protein
MLVSAFETFEVDLLMRHPPRPCHKLPQLDRQASDSGRLTMLPGRTNLIFKCPQGAASGPPAGDLVWLIPETLCPALPAGKSHDHRKSELHSLG